MKRFIVVISFVSFVTFLLGLYCATYQVGPFQYFQSVKKVLFKTEQDKISEEQYRVLKAESDPLDVEMMNIRMMALRFLLGIDTLLEMEKIKLLRNLAFQQVKVGSNPVPLKYSFDPDLYVRFYLESDEYAGLCGDIALTYHYLLMSFGIPSRIVGLFNDINPMQDSHVSIEVYSRELKKWIISDPTFNVFVVDSSTNTPIDFIGFKYLVQEGKGYIFDSDKFYVPKHRQIYSYYTSFESLFNYIYSDLWLNWDGKFVRGDGTSGNYLYEWRGINHYFRDRAAAFY